LFELSTGFCAHKLPFCLGCSESSVYQRENGSVKTAEAGGAGDVVRTN
jgi:hypothetical protein